MTDTAPHDIDAEKAVLGLALYDPQGRHLTAARAILNGGQEFYRPAHEALWALLCREQDAGRPIDATSIQAAVGADRDILRAFGGDRTRVLELWQAGSNVTPAPQHFAKIVSDLYRKRGHLEFAIRHQQIVETADADELDYVVADHLEQMVQAVEKRASKSTGSSWAAQDLTPVLEGRELDPPPEWLRREDGNALMYAGKVHTLAGEPETAKSWVALHGAVQAMHDGHHAAMIDFEDRASGVIERLLALGAPLDWFTGPEPQFRYVRPVDPLSTENEPDLLAAVQGASVVILDGVTEAFMLHGLDDRSGPDTARLYAMLPRKITDRTGAAVVMIDHVVKDDERQGRWATGSQHKLAGLDGAAYQARLVAPFGRGQHGICRITISKDRPGHVRGNALGKTAGEFHLDARNPDCVRAWIEKPDAMPVSEDGDARPTIYMGKIARYVGAHSDCSQNDIFRAVKGRDTWLQRALQCLVSEGYVEVSQGPRNTRLHRLVETFEEGS